MKQRKHPLLRALITTLIFIISIPIVFKLLNGRFIPTNIDITTIIIMAIMLIVLIVEATRYRKKFIDVTVKLQEAISDADIINYSYNNTFLDGAMNSFKEDCKILKEQGTTIMPDIADYINEDAIANYVRRDITDQIASAMTGLGILGTFVGLLLGMKDFNSEMAFDSTSTLLNGIKVAFYTSIFGIIASLLYTHFYSADIEENRDALERFYDSFYKNGIPNKENWFYGKLIDYNKQQTSALNVLATSIASEMAPKFAEAINECVMPSMEKLTKAINDNVSRVSDKQNDVLSEMVNIFIEKMNQSVDNQFHNLAVSIKEMCEFQNSSIEKIKEIFAISTNVAEHLVELNNDMAKADESHVALLVQTNEIMDKSKNYLDEFDNYTNKINDWTNELRDVSAVTKQYSEQIINDKNELMEHANKTFDETSKFREDIKETLITQIKSFLNEADKYKTEIQREVSESMHKNDDIKAYVDDVLNKISDYNSSLDNAYKNTNEKFEFGIETLIQQVTNLKSTSDESIKSNNDNLSKIEKHVEIMLNKVDDYNSSLNSTYKNVNKEYEEGIEKLIELVTNLRSISGESIKSNNDKITKIEKYIEEIKNSNSTLRNDFLQNNANIEKHLNNLEVAKRDNQPKRTYQENTADKFNLNDKR